MTIFGYRIIRESALDREKSVEYNKGFNAGYEKAYDDAGFRLISATNYHKGTYKLPYYRKGCE